MQDQLVSMVTVLQMFNCRKRNEIVPLMPCCHKGRILLQFTEEYCCKKLQKIILADDTEVFVNTETEMYLRNFQAVFKIFASVILGPIVEK